MEAMSPFLLDAAITFICIFLHCFFPVPRALALHSCSFPLGSAMVDKLKEHL